MKPLSLLGVAEPGAGPVPAPVLERRPKPPSGPEAFHRIRRQAGVEVYEPEVAIAEDCDKDPVPVLPAASSIPSPVAAPPSLLGFG